MNGVRGSIFLLSGYFFIALYLFCCAITMLGSEGIMLILELFKSDDTVFINCNYRVVRCVAMFFIDL